MAIQTNNVPMKALMFDMDSVQFTKEQEGTERKLQMTGYSGGIIKDHWWWDDLAIDLEGIQFSQKKFPILENHDTDRKIAFTSKIIVDENGLRNDPDQTVLLGNEYSLEFVNNAAKGFPYQSSIYVQPTVIERVEKDAEVEVNGFKLKGPGTVFRKCEFQEMSVCVFGWDNNTEASVFSKEVDLPDVKVIKFSKEEDSAELKVNHNKEDVNMDITKFKEEYPDVYKEVFAQGVVAGKQELENKFTAEKAKFEDTVQSMKEQLSVFAKNEAIRTERERKAEADAIFTNKLAKSDIPEHLYSKVKPQVQYSKFVGEDGVFDKTKFAEAIDAEIQSWIDAGVSSTVMGSSFSRVDADHDKKKKEQFEQEIDSTVDSLLSVVGVE